MTKTNDNPMKTLLLTAGLFLTIAGAAGAGNVFPYAWQQHKLENGLTVIMIPMPGTGLVAYHTVVRTGSRDEVDHLAARARAERCLISGPADAGPPVGYWAFVRDPDGHTLEVSFGQHVGQTVGAR